MKDRFFPQNSQSDQISIWIVALSYTAESHI